VILLSLSLLLLLGVRDHRAIGQITETVDRCVSENIARGAPLPVAQEVCRP
jgi:hypothetical protein